MENYIFLRVTVGVIATIGLYSVLYRETKFYRFFEHIFLGLAAGIALVLIWKETLRPQWWERMVGVTSPEGIVVQNGQWAYMFLLPIGLMGYFVFSQRHNWMSRIPIGIILGFWSGQQLQFFWNFYGPQIFDSMRPFIPNTTDAFRVPLEPATNAIYPSMALSNLIFVITFLCALSYFFFSFELKNKLLKSMNLLGRWMLMVGFGAIFGATVMARFALVIDRMSFIWREWLIDQVLPRLGG